MHQEVRERPADFTPGNDVNFYPTGNPMVIEAALRRIVKLFSEQPGLIRHAAGGCAESAYRLN